MSSYTLRQLPWLMAIQALTFSCQQLDDDPQTTGDTAALRAIHLSPDAPNVDVLISGQTAATIARDLAFHRSSKYVELTGDSATLDVVPAGGSVDQSVLGAELSFKDGQHYTAVVYGRLSGLAALVLEDDAGEKLGDGYMRLRVIHTAAGAGKVDIWLLPVNGEPSLVYDNVALGDVGPYLDLALGNYQLGFDVDDDARPELTFSLPSFSAGTIANVFAVAAATGELSLVAQVENGSTADIDPIRIPTEQPPPPPPPPPAPDPARLRALHLSPDAPAVNIYANGGADAAVSNLAFGAGTNYLELPPGEYDFDIGPATGTIQNSILRVQRVLLETEASYTAVAIGQLSTLRVLALQDQPENIPAGKIRVRAVHAAAGIGEVDIWNIPSDGAPAIIYENVEFGMVGDYLELPAASYTIGFDANNDAQPDFIFELPALNAGTAANIYAVRDASGSFYLLAQLDGATLARIDPKDLTPARLRVIHLSPDAPAVAVYANQVETPVVDNLAFGNGTSYLELPNGMYTFDVAPAATAIAQSVLRVEDLMLAPNASYTAAAIGSLSSLRILALEDNFEGVAAGTIRVRAIHAAAGVGRVNVLNAPRGSASSVLYANVDFGVAGNYLDIPAGAYRLGLDVDNDHRADLLFSLPHLPEGTVANVFASADANGNVSLIAQLADGTVARIPQDH